MTDPLAVFLQRAMAYRPPEPAMSTRYDVLIEAGLAVVTTTRSFTNQEEHAIEATLTFPVPVHATVFELTARIGERRLKATAQARKKARETYEDAMERGKSAVLHEELLKGVHMLSLGQIGAGEEVEATAVWCLPMSAGRDAMRLRIPPTVGDVYGASGLADSDELIHGGEARVGTLTTRCADGPVRLNGAEIGEAEIEVPLDRPIDLSCALTPPRMIKGRAADGRAVALRIAPRESEDAPLDVAVLLDHSGSMGERFSLDGRAMTKHQAAILGLSSASEMMTAADRVDLWEFDTAVGRVVAPELVGETRSALAFKERLSALTPPRGGTEIGGALAAVFAGGESADILLVTDGKSHALDVQELARQGRRVSVVLLGEDSLEAQVGHLAALTGGEVFIASAESLAETLQIAIESLRSAAAPRPSITGAPEALTRVIGGMEIAAEWRSSETPTEGQTACAAGALAAMLALPAMAEEAAAALAEAEGLVSHLTSLVLVDETGATQDGLPAHRKMALPSPAAATMDFMEADFCMRAPAPSLARSMSAAPKRARFLRNFLETEPPKSGDGVDWTDRPELLRKGDLSALPPKAADRIRRLAAAPELRKLAETLGLDPVVLALALLARSEAERAPGAGKFAKLLLGRAKDTELDRLSAKLGL